jgi:hypothetical protein
LFDILGKSVATGISDANLLHLDVSGIPPGTYLLEMDVEGQPVRIEKVIVQ